MYSLLLVIIYMAFISLGLPDSLLGSAWPVLYKELNVPLSYAGIITMIIAGGTILSSLLSDRITKKHGAGVITAASVMATAIALFGFSISKSFIFLCLWAIPYGLGAGAVDAALNNYVALHYASRHMSWLHCFWGVGAVISPYIMSYSLTGGYGWNAGYRTVSVIQGLLTVAMFISLPLWKRNKTIAGGDETQRAPLRLVEILKIKGVKYVLAAFFAYCALESTAGLWASSYLVKFRGVDTETAAMFASLFYIGITAGRFLCGFIADKVGDRKLIRYGICIIIFGITMIILPVGSNAFAFTGLVVVGLGGAPIYPSIIHSTPVNFGKDKSQAVIGVQMASAYCGSTFIPPVFGLIAGVNIGLYPLYLMIFAILMLFMSEGLTRTIPNPYDANIE